MLQKDLLERKENIERKRVDIKKEMYKVRK